MIYLGLSYDALPPVSIDSLSSAPVEACDSSKTFFRNYSRDARKSEKTPQPHLYLLRDRLHSVLCKGGVCEPGFHEYNRLQAAGLVALSTYLHTW